MGKVSHLPVAAFFCALLSELTDTETLAKARKVQHHPTMSKNVARNSEN